VQAPDVNIIATGNVVIDGSKGIEAGFLLSGKHGDDESDYTTCHDCNGVRGGNVTIQAAEIRIGETRGGIIDVHGGYGARYQTACGDYVGCNGGNGGTIKLSASGRLVIGPKTRVSFSGGDFTSVSSGSACIGADGTINLTGAPVKIYENSDVSNGHLKQNHTFYCVHDLMTYQRFTIYGSVNQADDVADKGQPGSVTINYGNPVTATDFCEDLYVLDLKSAAAISIKLSSAGVGDLDMFLLSFDLTQILGQSNGPTSSESITYSAGAGMYVVCVSWSDGQVAANEPQPYTLEVGP
jgi:hypothetical protein